MRTTSWIITNICPLCAESKMVAQFPRLPSLSEKTRGFEANDMIHAWSTLRRLGRAYIVMAGIDGVAH